MADEAQRRKMMEVVRMRASYYRANPHRFVKDFLGINLKPFQMILIYMMNISTHFMYLASRGQGKTFLVAIFCVMRCILYPGTRICIASGRRSQAAEVIDKILQTIVPNSALLRNEIESWRTNQTAYNIKFKCGSVIKVVTASDSSRSNRANILIVDEFRLVQKETVDKVLRKFLTAPRHPRYLDDPKYAHLTERNKEIYMTSAYFKKHWSWEKVQAYCTNLVDDTKRYFVCGLPYQLSIAEGLLQREAVEDEMSEEDFNAITWDMEMGCLFYGESEDAFFSYENFLESRIIPMPFYPSNVYNNVGNGSLKPPLKKDGEIRLVCVDVAVMGSKRHKNDATAIHILQLLPNSKGQYIRNLVYTMSIEGGHSEVQGLKVRKLYEEMYADYIVIDANGVGNGIVDVLLRDLTDPETGEVYPALTCKNNEEIAARYQGSSKNPTKAIYCIKATAQYNSLIAQNLKDTCNRHKLRMLINERDADNQLKKIKGFASLSPEWKEELLKPYIQATLTINEIVNLEYEVTTTAGVKIHERQRSDRKDRYSALAYGNQVATELERDFVKKSIKSKPNIKTFNFRTPKLRMR